MWQLLLASPFSAGGFWLGNVLAQSASAPTGWAELLAPLGAAAPFAALAIYILRRQEHTIDYLTGELQRVNGQTIDRFVTAINDATALHRESTRMWEQVLDELRRRPS